MTTLCVTSIAIGRPSLSFFRVTNFTSPCSFELTLSSSPSNPKSISVPTLFPIHCSCATIVPLGQSNPSNPACNLSAYFVIFNTHCRSGNRTTG